MKTIQQQSSTLETDVYVWRYALVVHARNDDDDADKMKYIR